jgi:hypothetical protein
MGFSMAITLGMTWLVSQPTHASSRGNYCNPEWISVANTSNCENRGCQTYPEGIKLKVSAELGKIIGGLSAEGEITLMKAEQQRAIIKDVHKCTNTPRGRKKCKQVNIVCAKREVFYGVFGGCDPDLKLLQKQLDAAKLDVPFLSKVYLVQRFKTITCRNKA